MNRHKRVSIGLALLWFSLLAHAEIYTWTDAQNHVHFSDKKPTDTKTQVVKTSINTYSSAEVIKSNWVPPVAPANKASAHAANVTMYSASWCGVCKQAHAYFLQKGIPFNEYDVETTEQGKNDFAAMGGRGVPIILVDDNRMNGFSATQFEQLYNHGTGAPP